MTTPTIGLLVLTRNGGRHVCRAIGSVASGVDRLVLVDAGSTDDTIAVVSDHWLKIRNERPTVISYTPENRPEGFLVDSHDRVGGADCDMLKPYTDLPFLADFGAARNAGWEKLDTDYVVYLDSDDVWELKTTIVKHADCGYLLRELVAAMEKESVAVAQVPYEYRRDERGEVAVSQLTARVFRRQAPRPWEGKCHERCASTGRVARMDGFGTVVDLDDLRDPGSRVHLRGFKILYRDYRDGNRRLPDLYSLAMEARQPKPLLAIELFLRVARATDWPEQRAKCYYEAGLVHENAFMDYAQAWEMQTLARAVNNNGPDAIFALARLALLRGEFEKCVELSQEGIVNVRVKNFRDVLQHNPLGRTAWPRYVLARAFQELKEFENARETVAALVADHPNVAEFAALAAELAVNKSEKQEPKTEGENAHA